jgi:hypothetical protein
MASKNHAMLFSFGQSKEERIEVDGVVEAFELTGHPHAKHCYAWSYEYENKGEPQYVMVLELPPVDSAETAVKIALTAQGK